MVRTQFRGRYFEAFVVKNGENALQAHGQGSAGKKYLLCSYRRPYRWLFSALTTRAIRAVWKELHRSEINRPKGERAVLLPRALQPEALVCFKRFCVQTKGLGKVNVYRPQATQTDLWCECSVLKGISQRWRAHLLPRALQPKTLVPLKRLCLQTKGLGKVNVCRSKAA